MDALAPEVWRASPISFLWWTRNDHNQTGLQNDLVKEYDLHDVGVEVLSPGDELSAELRVVEPHPC